MLFNISKDGDVFTQDPTVKAIPEFIDLYKAKGYGSKYIRYVVMVCDYESPYRMKPMVERKKAVSRDIFGIYHEPTLNDEIVLKAIDKYNYLQYDPIIELDQMYREKMAEFNEFIKNTTMNAENMEEILKAMKMQKEIVQSSMDIRKMASDVIKNRNQKLVIRGGFNERALIEDRLTVIKREDAV